MLRRTSISAIAATLWLAACSLPATPPSSVDLLIPTSITQTEIPIESEPVSPTVIPTDSPTQTPLPTATVTAFPLSGDLADVGFILPLVIQHVTESQAMLFFELQSPAEGFLLLDSVGGQEPMPLPSGESYVQMTVSDLTPDTNYTARVVLSAPDGYREPPFQGKAWGPVTFRTRDGDAPLRVGVLGDSGFGDSRTYALVEQMSAHNLDAVLHTGDVVYQIYNNTNAQEAYALKWFLPFAPLLQQIPIYPVVGNHDIEEAARVDGVPYYYHVFPAFTDPRFDPSPHDGLNRWYAFAYGDVQFLMLDTQVFYNEPGIAEQNVWLEDRLADDRFSSTIVVSHVPPFTSSSVHPNDGIPVQSWLSLFESAGLPLMLSGHSHNYERINWGNQTYVVTGGGSASLYPLGDEPHPGSQAYHQRTHFTLLEIHTDRIDITAIAPDGEILDQASIALTP